MKCDIHKNTFLTLDLETGFHRDYVCSKCQKVIEKALAKEKKRLLTLMEKKEAVK